MPEHQETEQSKKSAGAAALWGLIVWKGSILVGSLTGLAVDFFKVYRKDGWEGVDKAFNFKIFKSWDNFKEGIKSFKWMAVGSIVGKIIGTVAGLTVAYKLVSAEQAKNAVAKDNSESPITNSQPTQNAQGVIVQQAVHDGVVAGTLEKSIN